MTFSPSQIFSLSHLRNIPWKISNDIISPTTQVGKLKGSQFQFPGTLKEIGVMAFIKKHVCLGSIFVERRRKKERSSEEKGESPGSQGSRGLGLWIWHQLWGFRSEGRGVCSSPSCHHGPLHALHSPRRHGAGTAVFCSCSDLQRG